jgi:streptomycin 6-kinase
MLVALSQACIDALQKYFPDTAEDWIAAYPQLLQRYLQRWSLAITGRASAGWPTNQIFFVECSGKPLVLKMGLPNPEQHAEAIALKAYTDAGKPVVQLLDKDDAGFGFLLERILPGTLLRDEIRSDEAIKAALSLHRNLPLELTALGSEQPDLPHFIDWMRLAFRDYRRGSTPSPVFSAYLGQAEVLYRNFSSYSQALLHGDLHHENILRSGNSWVAIDPKGVIGPAPLECGRLLHNFIQDEHDAPLTHEYRIEILRHRFAIATEVLPYSARQLAEITFIDATLSTCWSLNVGDDGREGLANLAALSQLIEHF